MSWLIQDIKLFDNKIAIIDNNKNYTYSQLFLEIQRIKQELLCNIDQSEVVSILADYSFKSIALLLALHQNKNIIVPITSTIEHDIKNKLEESFSTKKITITETYNLSSISQKNTHPLLQELKEKKVSGLILFSSGSTGKPKAMIHNFDNFVDQYKNKKAKSLNILLFLMFDHIGGINTLLNGLAIGATLIITQDRNPLHIAKLLQDYKIRVLPSSPTFLNLMLMSKAHEKYNLESLKMITYGTEAMPESLLLRLKKVFKKTKFLQTFGTSETGIASTSSASSNSTYMKICDLNQEYKIVNNELWLRSNTQIIGYLNASMDSFRDEGWFNTGDLVQSGDDGYIKVIGRSKEVINVGGEKVLPNEVESLLLSIDEIDDIIVYASPNIITGQTVVCDVVTNKELNSKEIKKIIRKYCIDKIEIYKIPTKVNIVDKTNFGDRFKKIRLK